MRHLPPLLAFLLAAVPLVGCYPEYFASTSETDVIVTVKDPEADYQAYKTYVVSDEVFDLEDIINPPGVGLPLPEPPGPNDALILKTIDQNMRALGYTLETDPTTNPPDVGVMVGSVVTENWYWTWYPIWDPWWGWYPPVYYPPVGVPTSYGYGTLLMSIAVIGDRMPDDDVKVVWAALADGLLSKSESTNRDRIVRAIDQAFDQSPYLKLGGGQ